MKARGGKSALRVASIDIGTNSVRLLVADTVADGGFQRVFMDRRITRLGAGMRGSGRMGQPAVEGTLETLCVFLWEAAGYRVQRTLAVATGAVRDAKNRGAFVDLVLERTGLSVRVLSGEDEARWMMLGVSSVWPSSPDRWMVVDLGGGSTEFVTARRGEVEAARSVPLGMVQLTEETLHHDPPLESETTCCRNAAAEAFSIALGEMGALRRPPEILVGTAGTITTLAALDLAMDPYDGERVNGYRLPRASVERWAGVLSRMDIGQRRRLPGMEPGREDVILAGVLMFDQLMKLLGMQGIHVSDYGLLEGVAIAASKEAREALGGGGDHVAG